MPSGGQGRRRNLKYQALLKWKLQRKGAPYRWLTINTKASSKYIGISKDQKIGV